MDIKMSTDDEISEYFPLSWEQQKKQRRWDLFYLDMCKFVSQRSRDPSTKVGAVIVDKNNRPISFGYNGLPQRVKDTPERLNNRDIKLKTIIHAEMNALIFAGKSIADCTLYIFPFLACSNCCSMYIQAGIARVVAPVNTIERWKESLELSKELFNEAGVEVEEIDYND